MKKALFILLAILPMILHGQVIEPLVDTNKVWSQIVQQIFPPSYVKSNFTKFSGDTIVEAKQYYKVWYSVDSLMLTWNHIGFIREDGSHKVFYRDIADTIEHLIYDFELQVGDTIQLWHQNFPKLRLALIDSIYLYDKYVKRFNFDPSGTFWYEGIGDLCGVLESGMALYVGYYRALICFFEDDILKYHNSGYTSCYQNIVGMPEVEEFNQHHNVYPNPVTSQSTLEYASLTGEAVEVFIYSITGQLLKNARFTSNLTLMNSEFEPGLYFYVIQDDGKYSCGRFSVIRTH